MTDGRPADLSLTALLALWEDLERGFSHGAGLLERRIEPSGPCDAFAAVSKPDNHRILVLRAQAAHGAAPFHARTRSLDVTAESSGGSTTLYVRLLDRTHGAVFAQLALDLLRSARASANPRDALASMLRRLQAWRRMFEDVASDGLGRERQRGLFAELWFLANRIAEARGLDHGVGCWVGPLGEEQDFHLGRLAIEVKATGTHPPHRVTVTSELQLDDGGLDALFLVHVALDEREHHGESLCELIDSLLSTAVGPTRDLLDERLISAGYLDAHRQRYTTRYTLRSLRIFRIAPGFPRLTAADLPQGVGSLRYALSIDACEGFTVSDDDLLEAVRVA